MNEQEQKSYNRLKDYIIWLLSRRDYSRKELYDKSKDLSSRKELFFSDTLFESVMAKIDEYGYQSDIRTAESFINSYYNKGKGVIYIFSKLQEKGIDRKIATDILENKSEIYDFFEKALEIRLRKFPEPITEQNEKQKCYRFLASRGFRPDEISYAINEQV